MPLPGLPPQSFSCLPPRSFHLWLMGTLNPKAELEAMDYKMAETEIV